MLSHKFFFCSSVLLRLGEIDERAGRKMRRLLVGIKRFAFVLPVIALFCSTFASGQDASNSGDTVQGSDEWEMTIAPYVILPSLHGRLSVLGSDDDIDASLGDVISNLQFGAMGYLGVRKGKWGASFDALYMALGATTKRLPANVDVNEGVFTFAGLRQLHPKLDLLFGARWNYLNAQIQFKGPLETHLEDTKNWVDPIVGLQFRQEFGQRWHLIIQGDIGGFGVGSDIAWNLFPVVGVDLHERIRLGFGYRALGFDYSSGEGLTRFEYDMIVSGPVIGLSFSF